MLPLRPCCPMMVSLPFGCGIISGSLLWLTCHQVSHRANEELIVRAAADPREHKFREKRKIIFFTFLLTE